MKIWKNEIGIANAEFLVGKAEDVVPGLLEKHQGHDFIAVVDPPRAGLRMFPLFFLFLLIIYSLILPSSFR